MEITRLELWDDPGFTQGAVRQPGLDYTLPTPDLVVTEPLHPSWSDIYATMKITRKNTAETVDFLDLQTKSYLCATCEFNSGGTLRLYGWITGVECRSDSDTPMNIVTWTVDYWQTYKSLAEFRYGVVQRCSRYQFPQNFTPKQWMVKDMDPIITYDYDSGVGDGNGLWWLYFTQTIQDGSGTIVSTRTCCAPVYVYPSEFASGRTLYMSGYHENGTSIDYACIPNIGNVMGNIFDEWFGINPATINYCGICPVPPCRVRYTRDGHTDPNLGTADLIELVNPEGNDLNGSWRMYKHQAAGLSNTYIGYYATYTSLTYVETEAFEERPAHVDWDDAADDFNRWVITGWNNELIGEIPFGFKFHDMKVRVIVNQTSGYVEVRQQSTYRRSYYPYEEVTDTAHARAEGMCFTIPMIAVTVSENSYSEYVYSGQQEYDRASLRLANEKAMAYGMMDSAVNAANNAVWAGPLAPLVGGVTLATGIASTAGKYALNEAVFDPAQMKINTAAHARQTDALLMAGENGLDVYRFNKGGFCLIRLVMDTDSEARYRQMVDRMGYEAPMTCTDTSYGSIPTIQTLVDQGGPLQIAQLEVGGAIPPIAKQYITEMFNRGVYLL